jgi:ribose transport system permease protein
MGALKRIDRPLLVTGILIVVLIFAGSAIFPQILTAKYLLQQLQIASYFGVLAAGAMMVILLGHIDLSIPWTMSVAAIISTAFAGMTGESSLGIVSIPAALLFGCFVGLVNGVGVAFMRVPSMIWTLAVNAVLLGIQVFYTGGFAPQGIASPFMRNIAVGHAIGPIPNALFVWILVSLVVVFVLRRTPLGRYIYAIGNRERASYLSGIRTRWVIILCFMWAGFCSALGGVLLAGYANQAYQAMGDPYLLPTIAAVVVGGTHILGGRGTYSGTVMGVLLLTLLASILSVMQMEEGFKQIIYGSVIIVMLLSYGRSEKVQA